MTEQHFDALVAGAGPAGSAAAMTLARGGLRVALLDRYALTSGQAAGQAILEAVSMGGSLEKAYHSFLEDHVYPDLRGSMRFRWLFHHLDLLPVRLACRLACRLASKLLRRQVVEAVHGMRSRSLRKQVSH